MTTKERGPGFLSWYVRPALLVSLILALATGTAFAHQPFFENLDSTASTPMTVADPAISTALYGTLERPGDVDFYTFAVMAGQSVEIGMTIPQIPGQEAFAPSIGVIAPSLTDPTAGTLPAEATPLLTDNSRVMVLEPVAATTFFEPFSRTAYWRRQRQSVTFPAAGTVHTVHIVVWHPQDEVGRYVLVVGQREVPGGESGFSGKLADYWTPVNVSALPEGSDSAVEEQAAKPPTGQARERCSWFEKLIADLLGASPGCP